MEHKITKLPPGAPWDTGSWLDPASNWNSNFRYGQRFNNNAARAARSAKKLTDTRVGTPEPVTLKEVHYGLGR